MLKSIQKAKIFALDVLFPKLCLGCKKEGFFLCPGCIGIAHQKTELQKCPICSLRNFSGVICVSCKNSSNLRRFLFAHDYKNAVVRDMIHDLKYRSIRELAPFLAHFLIQMLKTNEITIPKTAITVPIPLHPLKLRKRGFNQAELIAELFSKHIGIRMVSDGLVRVKNTESQIEFPDFKERRKNMISAFSVTRPEEFAEKKIILIDDVSTSRATLDEAARVLKEAGARSVWGLVVAKG